MEGPNSQLAGVDTHSGDTASGTRSGQPKGGVERGKYVQLNSSQGHEASDVEDTAGGSGGNESAGFYRDESAAGEDGGQMQTCAKG